MTALGAEYTVTRRDRGADRPCRRVPPELLHLRARRGRAPHVRPRADPRPRVGLGVRRGLASQGRLRAGLRRRARPGRRRPCRRGAARARGRARAADAHRRRRVGASRAPPRTRSTGGSDRSRGSSRSRTRAPRASTAPGWPASSQSERSPTPSDEGRPHDRAPRGRVTLTVNGSHVTKTAGANLSLLRWLRDVADVTDPKYGCGEGVCGACTVLVDGQPVSSCIVLAAQVDGAQVTTAAGLCEPDGSLGPLQRAFHEHHAAQCGFCTPGMLLCAEAMLDEANGSAAFPGADPRGPPREPVPVHRLRPDRRCDPGRAGSRPRADHTWRDVTS